MKCALVMCILGLSTGMPSRCVHAQASKIQSLGGGRFMTEWQQRLPIAGVDRLRIAVSHNLGGQIVVAVTSTDTARVNVSKILRAESPAAAEVFDRAVNVRLERNGSDLRLNFDSPPGAPWEGTDFSVRCNVEILLPPNLAIDVDARHFDYDFEGPLRAVSIDTEFGLIKLRDVREKVDLRGSFTPIELTQVRGAIFAQTSYATIKVSDAIADPERAARFVNESGAIEISGIAGAFVVESSGFIKIDDAVLVGAASRLNSRRAPVELGITEFSGAQLKIASDLGPVSVTLPSAVSARFQMSVGEGGSIRTRGVELQTHKHLLSSGRIEGTAGRGEGVVDIEVTGRGMINVSGI